MRDAKFSLLFGLNFSPYIISKILSVSCNNLSLQGDLINFVDDILLAGINHKTVQEREDKLTSLLQPFGLTFSKEKEIVVNWCKSEFEFNWLGASFLVKQDWLLLKVQLWNTIVDSVVWHHSLTFQQLVEKLYGRFSFNLWTISRSCYYLLFGVISFLCKSLWHSIIPKESVLIIRKVISSIPRINFDCDHICFPRSPHFSFELRFDASGTALSFVSYWTYNASRRASGVQAFKRVNN